MATHLPCGVQEEGSSISVMEEMGVWLVGGVKARRVPVTPWTMSRGHQCHPALRPSPVSYDGRCQTQSKDPGRQPLERALALSSPYHANLASLFHPPEPQLKQTSPVSKTATVSIQNWTPTDLSQHSTCQEPPPHPDNNWHEILGNQACK